MCYKKFLLFGSCVFVLTVLTITGCTPRTLRTTSTSLIVTTSVALVTTSDTANTSTQISFVEVVPPPAPVPWPDIANYIATTSQINVKAGEEFAIGMYASVLPTQFTKSFDQNYVGLIDDQVVDYLPVTSEGTEWFLFKAIKEGTTEIVFQYPLEYTKIFKIIIN
jgi:hypothetical protein